MTLSIRITEKNGDTERTIVIGEAPKPVVVHMGTIDLGAFGAAGKVATAEAADPVKLDADFKPLHADVTGPAWVYTHDLKTDLVWTRGEAKVRNWDDAKKTAEAVGEGFRMPTIQERLSIVKYDAHEPAIDTRFYESPASDISWTSTPANWNAASAAWYVSLSYGGASALGRGGDGFVRAVRSGVPSGQ